MIEPIIFYVFAFFLLLSAGMVTQVHNTVFAALFLILAFFSSAVIWLLLAAEFLAILLVLIYVGAVMVLFMFVVMMLDISTDTLRKEFTNYLPVGIAVAILMAVSMVVTIKYAPVPLLQNTIQKRASDYSNTSELGIALYTDYLYHLEIAGAILLVAIIAAIALTMRKPRANKRQQMAQQVTTKKSERLRIVKMPSKKTPANNMQPKNEDLS